MVSIAAVLLVAVALVSLLNMAFAVLPLGSGAPVTLQAILAWPLRPVMWLIGIPWAETGIASTLMATKTVLNEFVSYVAMAHLPPDALDPRSRRIMTYAMCGFANFGSAGIMVGGMGALVPERRAEVVTLGLRSIVSGTIATCMSGAVAGLL
jgi:CNT family concentrative nucleoside transporter